jgi:hypothetical protein
MAQPPIPQSSNSLNISIDQNEVSSNSSNFLAGASNAGSGFNNKGPMFGNETDHHVLVFRNAIA